MPQLPVGRIQFEQRSNSAIETPAGVMPNKRAFDRLRAALAQHNREYPVTMQEIPEHAWPFVGDDPRLSNPPKRVWRSSRFIACLYVEPGKPALRLSICRAVLNDGG